ncbi:OTU-domain-containing protein [Xylariaceae sp. FL0662B]|nr:OTU-domain-containing protein [Xylariaceae sp. FL0662B]
MKIRYKAPSGGGTLEVDDGATVGQLLDTLKSSTGFADVTVKYGWPPQALSADQDGRSVQSLGLQRESLTVVPVDTTTASSTAEVSHSEAARGPTVPPPPPPPPLRDAPKKKDVKDQNISVYMPETSSTLVLRVMPDDNSCLFTAVGGALRGLPPSPDGYTPQQLRRIVVDHILSNPDKYSAVVLEKSPEAYCARMLSPDTWGGAIELGIISELFNLEICVVDVKTGNVIRYGEGQHELRCVLVYSNVHYDRVAEIFVEDQEVMEFDVTRWAVEGSDQLIAHTKEMCKRLKEDHHYFTDTSDFVVLCNDCGWMGQGQKALAEHSLKTRHANITEIADT